MPMVSFFYTLLSQLFLENAYYFRRHIHRNIGKYKVEGLFQLKGSSLHTHSQSLQYLYHKLSLLSLNIPFLLSKLVKRQEKEQTLHGYLSQSFQIYIQKVLVNSDHLLEYHVSHYRLDTGRRSQQIYSVPHIEGGSVITRRNIQMHFHCSES